MATSRTYAEVLGPDHATVKLYKAGIEKRPPGVVLAGVRRQAGGAYETTTPRIEKVRGYIGEAAELTSDDELLGIAELPEVPVSLENCRQLDPQTRVVMFCRLNVSPAETRAGGRSRPPAGLGTNHCHLIPEEDHARPEMRIPRGGNAPITVTLFRRRTTVGQRCVSLGEGMRPGDVGNARALDEGTEQMEVRA